MSTQKKFKLIKKVSTLNKPLKLEFKKFFISLSKSAVDAYNAEWDKASNDALDSLSAIGIEDSCEERAWLLISRSLTRAVFSLVEEHSDLFLEYEKANQNIEKFCTTLGDELDQYEINVDENFFNNPKSLSFLNDFSHSFKKWLTEMNLPNEKVKPIQSRFSTYFIYALHEEWLDKHEDYKCLQQEIDSPFTKASREISEWERYRTSLFKEVEQGMFHEAFSLKSLFIWPRAYTYKKNKDESLIKANEDEENTRKTFWLKEELSKWMSTRNPKDAIRIISGGPGSGKSSFSRMFAAEIALENSYNVIFVPLHRLKVKDDFDTAMEQFLNQSAQLSFNPMQIDNNIPILLILDGLDELAMQGKVGAETAIQFIRHIREKVNEHNSNQPKAKLLTLIGSREIVVQAINDDFRKEGQIIHLMPYYVDSQKHKKYITNNNEDKLFLEIDQREEWWNKFQQLNNEKVIGIPNALNESKLRDVTAQPLLNYLVALSVQRGELDFTKEQNLNAVYADLLEGVYERGYDHKYKTLDGISFMQFSKTLEDIALAVWHADGRKATLDKIEKQCDKKMLVQFSDGAQKGVVKLLTAFYFRHSGDAYEQTFEFTHKSFGEYLIAKRLVRSIATMVDEMKRHEDNFDTGWDEVKALEQWYIWTGAAIIDEYIFDFLENELLLMSKKVAREWQLILTKLLSHTIQHDLPRSKIIDTNYSFKRMVQTARNSKKSLLAALNVCAQRSEEVSEINCSPLDFGTFLYSLKTQRIGPKNDILLSCLSYISIKNSTLSMQDFYGANFKGSIFKEALCEYTVFVNANLSYSNFSNANFWKADLSHVNFKGAILVNTVFKQTNLTYTNLTYANLKDANFKGTNFKGTNLEGANLEGANLKDANLKDANLKDANLKDANLKGANLKDANLKGTNFEGANLKGTNLEGEI